MLIHGPCFSACIPRALMRADFDRIEYRVGQRRALSISAVADFDTFECRSPASPTSARRAHQTSAFGGTLGFAHPIPHPARSG
jgi:hypothetical protein